VSSNSHEFAAQPHAMKTLTLLRHAKSGWDDPVARDFDRGLNERGKRGAKLVGRHMRKLGLEFDAVVSSPAVRCVDTLDGIWDGYGRVLHPVWDRRVYLASGATLLDVVHDFPDADHVLMCGHNPGLEDLILMLVPDGPDNPFRDEVEEKLPTASVAELEINVAKWSDVKANVARFTRLVRPRDLSIDLGPERL
jgi:phosphohistidine phosphatase